MSMIDISSDSSDEIDELDSCQGVRSPSIQLVNYDSDSPQRSQTVLLTHSRSNHDSDDPEQPQTVQLRARSIPVDMYFTPTHERISNDQRFEFEITSNKHLGKGKQMSSPRARSIPVDMYSTPTRQQIGYTSDKPRPFEIKNMSNEHLGERRDDNLLSSPDKSILQHELTIEDEMDYFATDFQPQLWASTVSEFDRASKELIFLTDTWKSKYGFEIAWVMCSGMESEDPSLACVHETENAEEFFQVRCRATHEQMTVNLKVHVADNLSRNAVRTVWKDSLNETTPAEAQPSRSEPAVFKSAGTTEATHLLKTRIVERAKEAGFDISTTLFPWKTLRDLLAQFCYQLFFWPHSARLPGEQGTQKGISSLRAQEQTAVFHALDCHEDRLEFRGYEGDVQDLLKGKVPVIIGAPGPSSRSRCMFVAGNIKDLVHPTSHLLAKSSKIPEVVIVSTKKRSRRASVEEPKKRQKVVAHDIDQDGDYSDPQEDRRMQQSSREPPKTRSNVKKDEKQPEKRQGGPESHGDAPGAFGGSHPYRVMPMYYPMYPPYQQYPMLPHPRSGQGCWPPPPPNFYPHYRGFPHSDPSA